MLQTNDLLDRLKAAYQLKSDYALAKKLGLTTAAISRYRKNVGIPDDRVAVEIAELLDLDPFYLVACMNMARAEKAHDRETVEFWKSYAA